MWQVYPYGHTKLKLNKDLKTAEAHLRISLIDSEQIQNMSRIYNDRKDYYRIDSSTFNVPKYIQQEIKEQQTTHLSYKEKVELYRQRLQSEKLQNKYNNLFKKTEKRKYKMRKPVLYKMLQTFEQTHKHEDKINVIQDLKQSEKNLEMIKINTNRRANFKKVSKNASMLDRPRFISLENGLPQKDTLGLPDWRDFIEGKYAKPGPTAYSTNITQFQNKLDACIQGKTKIKKSNTNTCTVMRQHSLSPPPLKEKTGSLTKQTYFTHYQNNFRSEKQKEHNFTCQRCKQQTELKRNSSFYQEENASRPKSYNTHSDLERRKLFSRHTTKKGMTVDQNNVSKTAQKIFNKSQNCSKEVIKTMSGFYQFKSNKKEDYKKMVYHLKNDRPLTSDIRRKNYKLIGEQNIQQVKKYRVLSEKQRVNLKEKNSELYKQLLQAIAAHSIEELPLSGKIMERIRKILESNYVLTRQHFEYIIEPSLYEQRDVKSQYLVRRIQTLIQRNDR